MDAQPADPEQDSFFGVLGAFWKHIVFVDIMVILFAHFGAHNVNYGMLVSWSIAYVVGECEHPLLPVPVKMFCVSISQVTISILIALNSFVRMLDVIHGTEAGSLMAVLTGIATLTSLLITWRKLDLSQQ